MKKQHKTKTSAAILAAVIVTLAAFVPQTRALDSLTNGVVAYWPMDTIDGGVITSDKGPNAFDLQPYTGAAVVPFNGVNIAIAANGGPHANINGKQNGTNALVCNASQNTVLGYIAPVSSASDLLNLSLPPLNLPNWTLSFWLKAPAGGANSGNRMFAIAEKPLGNGPNILWDIAQYATDNTQIDHFHRQISSLISGNLFADDNSGGSHIQTVGAVVFDNNWHNITIIAKTITNAFQPTISNLVYDATVPSFAIAYTGYPLDTLTTDTNGHFAPFNAPSQVDTNQFYRILRADNNATAPYNQIANNGNGATYTDTAGPTSNSASFYRVQKPLMREQVRYLYIDGTNVNITPGDEIENNPGIGAMESHPSKNGARFRTNGWFFCDTFIFGGFIRSAGEGGFVNASFSDAAVWNRALDTNELAAYIRDGITNSLPQAVLTANLGAEYPATAQGDTDLLNWTGSKSPATLALNPGSVNVTPQSNLGIGNTNATINSNIVYTLVTTRGVSSVTSAPVSVICVSNIAANWHYIDSFTYLPDGPIVGNGKWSNPKNGPATTPPNAAQPLQVHTANGGNKVASFDGFWVDPNTTGTTGDGGIAGRALGSFSSTVGKTNTLFFRFYIDPVATNQDINFGQNLIDFRVGVQDLGIGDPAFNYGGPGVEIIQNNNIGGPVNLTASSGNPSITVTPGGYNYLTDPSTGDTNGLAVGKVYSVWIDFINQFPGVIGGFASGGEQTNAALYTVWLQREDWPQRTNLFSSITCTNTGGLTQNGTNYPTGFLLSNRNYGIASQENILLGPTATLGYAAIYMLQATSPQPTNGVRFDDFYISKLGTNGTVPVTAGSFVTP